MEIGKRLIIKACFDSHVQDMDEEIKFTFGEYRDFWEAHQIGDLYKMRNVNGSEDICKIAYYPLPNFVELRALVEIEIKGGTDFREVPVHFLKRI